MGDEKSCEFCKKGDGLAILLTRYTLMGAAKADGVVSHNAFKGVTAASGHSFMQKALRSGYLYVFDENQKRWEAYYVSKAGYCMQYDFNKPAPPAIKTAKPCVDIDSHKAKTLVIVLKNPKKSGNVYFRFSDVEWTAAKKKEYANPKFYREHMQSIDIKQWLAGKSQGHVPIVTGLTNNVLDFATPAAKKKMFAKNISGTLFTYGEKFVEVLKSQVKLIAGKETSPHIQNGLILPIDDPVGMAIDVAAYLKHHNDLQRALLTREENVGGVLQNLRSSIRQSVEEREVQLSKEWGEAYRNGIDPLTGERMLLTAKMREELARKAENVTAADLDRFGKAEWAKYEKYIDPKKYQAAVKRLGEKEQAKRRTPSPLELCFLNVFKSTFFAKAFFANFDENSTAQGAAYTDTVAAAIADTHENYFCSQYYANSLSGSLDNKNVLLSALALNQKELKKKIAALDKINWSGVSWDNLFATFKTVMEQHGAANYQALSGLVGNLAGPLFELCLKSSIQANKALVLLGVMSNQKFTHVTVTGSLKEVYKTLSNKVIQTINENNGNISNTAKVKAQIKLSEIQMERIPGTKQVTVSVLLNNKALGNATTVKGVADLVKVGEIKVSSMRASGLPGLAGVINSLLQYAVLTKSWSDLAAQSAGLDTIFLERVTRLGSGIAGLSAAIGEGIQQSLAAWAKAATQRIGASALREGGRIEALLATKFFGKLAIGAAFLNGAWDVWNGYAKLFSSKAIEGTALIVGGVTGFIAAVAFFFAAPILGWIMAAICVIATLIVVLVMDNDLQVWINRSCLGKHDGEKPYTSTAEEMQAFNKLFAS